jgi:hypothetical protein
MDADLGWDDNGVKTKESPDMKRRDSFCRVILREEINFKFSKRCAVGYGYGVMSLV